MNGPWGRRGSILAHFGWTWDYLHYEIPWPVVLRMLADGPRYNFDDDDDNDAGIAITDENAEEVMKLLNNSAVR